jgi:hypothetical protein
MGTVANAKPIHDGATTERQDTIMLDEVVVSAVQQLTSIDGDGILTKIQGSVLQNLGSAKDVLGYIPGVINNNGSIEVVGKGNPAVYINGRKMRNPLELDQLKSYQIKDVKVITNPGARYDSGTNAVIKITTVKNQGDGLALDTRTACGYRDYLYGSEQVNMNYRVGGLDLFGLLHYDFSKVKGANHFLQNSWTSRRTQSELTAHYKNRQQIFDGQIGFNYAASSGHSFGAYYQGLGKYNRQPSNSDASFSTDGVITGSNTIEKNDDTDYFQHLVDAYYSGSWNKWTADISFSYLWKSETNAQEVKEEKSGRDIQEYHFNDNNRGRMFAGEINLAKNIWKGSLNMGASLTDSHRDDVFTDPENIIRNSDNTVKETNIGIYAQTMQTLGPIMIQAGLRYEHISNRYFENDVMIKEQSREYNEILPSATLTLPIKKSMVQLGYSRKYSRPQYSQLSSTIHYSNEYLYETGNPGLKSTCSDIVSLNFKHNWLMLMASYKHIKDRVITISEEYEGNPEITLLKKINSPNDINNLEVMVSIYPGFIGKVYYPMLTGGVMAQFYSIDYQGKSIEMNNPIGIIRFNNIFKFPSNYMLAANFSWRSKGDSDNITLAQSWQIDIAASKSFSSNWDLKLSLNDIFNTARKSYSTIYSGVRDISMEKISNTRSVEITIGYRFNVPRSKYKGKGAGNNEKDRL